MNKNALITVGKVINFEDMMHFLLGVTQTRMFQHNKMLKGRATVWMLRFKQNLNMVKGISRVLRAHSNGELFRRQ
jgi:hypothetical protein